MKTVNTEKGNIVTVSGASEIEVKKSRFLGDICNIRSEEEAKTFLDAVAMKYRDARHHCFAIRIGEPGKEYERYSDDGEPQGTAGKPILSVLQGAGLTDVCVVVTRYFGGTLLGTGGLTRAYSDAAKAVLSDSVISELEEGYRFLLTSDYPTSNRIKYLAETMGIYTEKEEYAEYCRMTYISEAASYQSFTDKIRELSSGRILPEETKRIIYFLKNQKPEVYKTVEMC